MVSSAICTAISGAGSSSFNNAVFICFTPGLIPAELVSLSSDVDECCLFPLGEAKYSLLTLISRLLSQKKLISVTA